MQIHTKRVGMTEALGQDLTIITPDGWKRDDQHAPLAISFYLQDRNKVSIRSNLVTEGPITLAGVESIRHVRDALTEVLKLLDAE